MARGKSLKTILKELRQNDSKIIGVKFFNDAGESWAAHILYTQEFLLTSEIGKKWLAHKTWKSLEVIERDENYKEVEVRI